MSALAPFFARVEASGLATSIGESVLLTAVLSGIHLLGLTLLVGAVIVSSLRLLGLALRDRPVAEVTGAARIGIVAGLFVSVTSGLLLLAPRISSASENWIFQTKMLLLAAAVAVHFLIYRSAARGDSRGAFPAALTGALGSILWLCVVLAGCAFILIE